MLLVVQFMVVLGPVSEDLMWDKGQKLGAKKQCWKTCKEDFALNIFRNDHNEIRGKEYPVSDLFCIISLELWKY